MAKQVSSMAIEASQTLSPISLLREALEIPKRNKKLIVSIILFGLLPLSLLVMCHDLAVGPLLVELEDLSESKLNLAEKARIKKDLMVLMAAESFFFLAFSLLFPFAVTATTFSSSVVYTGNYYTISLKELFLWIITTWKRPLITWLYIGFMTITYGFLVIILFLSLAFITRGLAFVAGIVVVGFLASLFYLYLANVWILGLVVSVLEEDCYGLKALGRAIELLQRKKFDGFVLLLLLVLFSAPIFVVFYLNITADDIGAVARFGIGTLLAVFICLVKLFTFVVYTVFYHECKNSHGEEVEMKAPKEYSLVSNIFHSTDSLP